MKKIIFPHAFTRKAMEVLGLGVFSEEAAKKTQEIEKMIGLSPAMKNALKTSFDILTAGAPKLDWQSGRPELKRGSGRKWDISSHFTR